MGHPLKCQTLDSSKVRTLSCTLCIVQYVDQLGIYGAHALIVEDEQTARVSLRCKPRDKIFVSILPCLPQGSK